MSAWNKLVEGILVLTTTSKASPLPVDPVDANGNSIIAVGDTTDRSGTIATGGTAQNAMAANTSRKGFILFNNSVGSLWVNFTGTATAGGGSVEVKASGYWSIDSLCPRGAMSIIGATTGQAYTLWELT